MDGILNKLVIDRRRYNMIAPLPWKLMSLLDFIAVVDGDTTTIIKDRESGLTGDIKTTCLEAFL